MIKPSKHQLRSHQVESPNPWPMGMTQNSSSAVAYSVFQGCTWMVLQPNYSSSQEQTICWKMGTERMVTNCRERNWSSPFSSLLCRFKMAKNTSILHVTVDRFQTPVPRDSVCHLNNLCHCCFTAGPYQQFTADVRSLVGGGALFSISNYDKLYVTVVFAAKHWSNMEKSKAPQT